MFGKASDMATLGEQRLPWTVCHFKDKKISISKQYPEEDVPNNTLTIKW